jgi:hypothetical protein
MKIDDIDPTIPSRDFQKELDELARKHPSIQVRGTLLTEAPQPLATGLAFAALDRLTDWRFEPQDVDTSRNIQGKAKYLQVSGIRFDLQGLHQCPVERPLHFHLRVSFPSSAIE